MQLDPGVEQRVVLTGERLGTGDVEVGRGGEDPRQRVHVAETAAAFLEVGLERGRDLSGRLVPGGHGLHERRQDPLRLLAPLGRAVDGKVGGERRITGEAPDTQERGGGREVVGGEREGFGHRSDGVADLQFGVPHRVPEPLGGAEVDRTVVEEQEVEVALGCELATAMAAGGNERDAGPFTEELVVELDDPRVDETGVGVDEGPTA